MNVSAKQREFNIFDLFLHDNDAVEVVPFDQWAMARRLDEMAERLYPDRYVHFVSPEQSCNSQWSVNFNKDRHIDGHVIYPNCQRMYDERAFRQSIPAELDEVLLEMNKADIVL